ncbi:dual specificity protein phosphatase family protein [Halorarius halobius]|uniref:dual specificity protein phosphatase family protein n=1 Tax=Halorarius halobius TaxID=2962671 RepID=UPI0020CD8512|nr:dual specificity protein phosphatase [Halorarius halobius]
MSGSDAPEYRPFGYVEDHPVVRRVSDGLFLGNVHAASPDEHDRSFEYVLSATADPQPLTTHHRPLVDGDDVTWSRFEAAAETARDLYGDGSLLVHCEAGVSRSSTLVATALAAEDGIPLRGGIEAVQAARPMAQPHPALHEMAVVYLAAQG